MIRRLAAAALLTVLGCSDDGEDLPPVGTEWEECDANGGNCTWHEIGLIVECEAHGSWLETELPEQLPSFLQHCATVDDKGEIETTPAGYAREFMPIVCDPASEWTAPDCSYTCTATDAKCDLAER